MKRTEIKRRPLADTVLATLEPDTKEYLEHDGNSLYLSVRPDGNKFRQLRYKKPDGKWSWLGLGSYPEVGGALARQKLQSCEQTQHKGVIPLPPNEPEKQQTWKLPAIRSSDWLASGMPPNVKIGRQVPQSDLDYSSQERNS